MSDGVHIRALSNYGRTTMRKKRTEWEKFEDRLEAGRVDLRKLLGQPPYVPHTQRGKPARGLTRKGSGRTFEELMTDMRSQAPEQQTPAKAPKRKFKVKLKSSSDRGSRKEGNW
jgi:hypothetical protein